MVVAPPVDIAIPVLPPAYSTLWIGGVPYCYANNTFYAAVPPGGYVVAAPPAGVETDRDRAAGRSTPGAAHVATNGRVAADGGPYHRVLVLLRERPRLLPDRAELPGAVGPGAAGSR